MINKRRFNNNASQRRGRRLWNLIKSKFTEPEEELTIDEYDYTPEMSESEKMQDELEPICPLFKELDEDARFERHMKPIRELQAQNDKVFKTIVDPTEHDESDEIEATKRKL
jgi:hypothetical protein